MAWEQFTTHTGEVVTGERLKAALNKVADDVVEFAYEERGSDWYAKHVTESTKDQNLNDALLTAEKIRKGEEFGFWVRQRVNTELTGTEIGFLERT